MFLFQFFRSFLPIHNPIGFGASDFLEFALAGLLLACAFAWRPGWERMVTRVAERPLVSFALLAVLPVALRLILLPHHPVPTPDVADEFSHLLVADTLRHFRFANPSHPLHQFFETFFVLQTPTYSSVYPIGQGLAMAVGRAIFGLPWAGVLLATSALCGLTYWMLRAWTTPLWAMLGGVLALMEFGPLSLWMNDYWGGSVAAASGCLVFGALPRLRAEWRVREAVLLGAGLAMHLLIRPFESFFLLLSVALYFLPSVRRSVSWRPMMRAGAVVGAFAGVFTIGALGVTLAQNKSVTGNWMTLPYQLSQYQYGVPAALSLSPNPVPHNALTPEQQTEYEVQRGFRGDHAETLASYFGRLGYRVRFYRFFFLTPLYFALPFFLLTLREWRFAWVALTLSIFSLGVNFFPAWQFHYVAACTSLFVLVSVTGLARLSQLRPEAARLIVFLCVAHFVFWYTAHLFDGSDVSLALRNYETWDSINHQNPERRIAVDRQIAAMPGNVLVFVRYYPQHVFREEWVWNAADIDSSRVVYARDLGAAENQKLIDYFKSRKVLLLEPDFRPMPRLGPYESTPAPLVMESVP